MDEFKVSFKPLSVNEIVALGQPWLSVKTGVYFLIKDGEIVYVGQSINCLSRLTQHTNDKEFDSVAILPCEMDELEFVESRYIKMLQPRLNIRGVNKVWQPDATVRAGRRSSRKEDPFA